MKLAQGSALKPAVLVLALEFLGVQTTVGNDNFISASLPSLSCLCVCMCVFMAAGELLEEQLWLRAKMAFRIP